ncbi:GM19817 [Drosophila sechellia]|uniref:GM19817 n=2 Tax=Drosophila sechellia TaxID=7238 RepID=B4HPR6_DROSE|nr:GM19817 [Drosophila sechellia]
MHNNMRVFIGNKRKSFEQRQLVVDGVIKDVTGEAMSAFFTKNLKTVSIVHDLIKERERVDNRPLWKILKEQGKCDVQSIPEVPEEMLSPMEIARRKRAFNIFHQSYINDSWIDVLFMKMLCKNPNLLLPQCKESSYFLQQLSSKQYEIVRKFMKMLQSRSPLYLVNYLKYGNKAMSDKYREAYLFRVQYQTHRNMNQALKEIRALRKAKKVQQLSKFVEELMGTYVVLKTARVMCWKFEFLNEVYNTMALTLAEQLRVPKGFTPHGSNAILRLLRLPVERIKDFVPVTFGDRAPEPEGNDPATTRAKRLTARLEHRMVFAKYSIEKCYLLHQISQSYLDQGRHSECTYNARKAIKESKNCNSNLWKFLSVVQIVKANAILHKLEQTKEALEDALPIAHFLKSSELILFIENCMACNTEDSINKRATLMQSRRVSKSESVATHSLVSGQDDSQGG